MKTHGLKNSFPSKKQKPSLSTNPFTQFKKWYHQAETSGIKQPDAMTLATATSSGIPSARIVLFKGLVKDRSGIGLSFFTNFQSKKGKELKENPQAACVFYWSELDIQIRIEGKVTLLSDDQSDAYWKTRPRQSQIGAIASRQSTPIASRAVLEKKIQALNKKYAHEGVPRPQNWGGYILHPHTFEFWMLGDFRIHDRFCYKKKGTRWKISRLSP